MDDSKREIYAEGTALVEALGDHPRTRILAALLAEHGRDLTPSEIADQAGLHRTTFYDHIDTLLDYGLVEQTRTVNQSPLYAINKENEAAKKLAEFEWELVDYMPHIQAESDDETR